MIILIIHIIVSYDQNISLIFYVKDGSHVRLWHDCDIRLVFTLPPRDSTLQYKRCAHLWNNFPCIITLDRTNLKRMRINDNLKFVNIIIWRLNLVFFSYKKSSEGLNNDLKIKLENVKMKGTMQKDWMNSILLTS